jgi:hypothetical protein
MLIIPHSFPDNDARPSLIAFPIMYWHLFRVPLDTLPQIMSTILAKIQQLRSLFVQVPLHISQNEEELPCIAMIPSLGPIGPSIKIILWRKSTLSNRASVQRLVLFNLMWQCCDRSIYIYFWKSHLTSSFNSTICTSSSASGLRPLTFLPCISISPSNDTCKMN